MLWEGGSGCEMRIVEAMEQVTQGVYRLGTRSHNFYVLVEDGEATVIDAGCSKEWPVLQSGLSHLGIPLDSVAAVVVTHGHADHFGFGAKAQQEGLDVRVHEDDEKRVLGTYTGRFSAGPFDLPMYRPSTWKVFIPLLRAGVMKLDHLETVGTFQDEDVLDLPGRPRAIHTPGHTEGHVMFLSSSFGVLFTGDGLVTMDMYTGKAGPQLIRDVFNLDTRQAMESLDRIVGVEAGLLLPGHGDPWAGSPREAVELIRSE